MAPASSRFSSAAKAILDSHNGRWPIDQGLVIIDQVEKYNRLIFYAGYRNNEVFHCDELLTTISDVFKDERVKPIPYYLVMPTVTSSNLKTLRRRAPAEILMLSGLELLLPHPYLHAINGLWAAFTHEARLFESNCYMSLLWLRLLCTDRVSYSFLWPYLSQWTPQIIWDDPASPPLGHRLYVRNIDGDYKVVAKLYTEPSPAGGSPPPEVMNLCIRKEMVDKSCSPVTRELSDNASYTSGTPSRWSDTPSSVWADTPSPPWSTTTSGSSSAASEIDSSGIGSDTNSGTIPLHMDGRDNAPRPVLAGEAFMEAPNVEALSVAEPINNSLTSPNEGVSSLVPSHNVSGSASNFCEFLGTPQWCPPSMDPGPSYLSPASFPCDPIDSLMTATADTNPAVHD